jgi:hypothetical protein
LRSTTAPGQRSVEAPILRFVCVFLLLEVSLYVRREPNSMLDALQFGKNNVNFWKQGLFLEKGICEWPLIDNLKNSAAH